MSRLDHKQDELTLKYVRSGLSFREIGKLMGRNHKTIYARWERLRKPQKRLNRKVKRWG